MKFQYLYALALTNLVNCETTSEEIKIPDNCTNKKLNTIKINNDFNSFKYTCYNVFKPSPDCPTELPYAEETKCRITEKKENEAGDFRKYACPNVYDAPRLVNKLQALGWYCYYY